MKSKKLRFEGLEERRLLSVDPLVKIANVAVPVLEVYPGDAEKLVAQVDISTVGRTYARLKDMVFLPAEESASLFSNSKAFVLKADLKKSVPGFETIIAKATADEESDNIVFKVNRAVYARPNNRALRLQVFAEFGNGLDAGELLGLELADATLYNQRGKQITEDRVAFAGVDPVMHRLNSYVAGELTISKDASSPMSDIIVSGNTVTLGVFRLTANNVESLDVDDLTFTTTGGNFVDTYYLYNESTLIGAAPGGMSPKFILADNTVTVPKNSYARLTLKAKMVGKDLTDNNTTVVPWLMKDAVTCTGLSSGASISSGYSVAAGSIFDLYKTKPTFSAREIPARVLIPSSQTLVAIFDVTADLSGDVTFEQGLGELIVGISRAINDSDGQANTWTLKDDDGILLDSALVDDSSSTVAFDFFYDGLIVPAGTKRSFYIYANTTEMEDSGDSIQVYLDDSNANNITWSINGDGNQFHDADKIFRGDIYSGLLVNPS